MKMSEIYQARRTRIDIYRSESVSGGNRGARRGGETSTGLSLSAVVGGELGGEGRQLQV